MTHRVKSPRSFTLMLLFVLICIALFPTQPAPAHAAPLPAHAAAPQPLPGLFGIEMRSATDGWIVGNYRAILRWNGAYRLLRWNGSQWNLWTYSIEQTYIPLTAGE